MNTLYFLAVVAALINLCILFIILGNNEGNSFVLLFLTVVIVNLAYWSLSISKDEGQAVLAHNFSCLDGSFLTLFLVCSMIRICQLKISKKVFVLGTLISTSALAAVFTTGVNNWYCKSYELVQMDTYSYLARTYGPLRNYFLVVLIFYMLAPFVILVYAFRNKNKVSYIYATSIAVIQAITIACFFVESILGLHVELLPFIYILMELIIIYVVNRTRIYDPAINARIARRAFKETGSLMFDMKKRYLGCGVVARYFFPELMNNEIDKAMTDEYTVKHFAEWLDQDKLNEVKYIERDDRIYQCTLKPLTKENGTKQIGYLIEVRDDTIRQEYISKLNEANEQLKVYAQQAEYANKAKSSFLSSMSHEIRTPINTIMGMNEIIIRESNDPEIKEYANDVRNASNMLLALVNDILDFSKIESGKMEVINTDYSPNALVHDLDIMIRTRAEAKGLALDVSVPVRLPEVLNGDETKIRQIALNLLTNAVKYTDEGTVRLNVMAIKPADEKEDWILSIKVSDTGRGISEENIEKLFDSFTRVDEANNKGIEGTGLGLAITKRFTDLMNGTITVTSDYGKGSTFEFRVPQKLVLLENAKDSKLDTIESFSDSEEFALETQKAREKQQEEKRELPAANVLVVDDVAMNLKVFVKILKNTKLLIDTADGGSAGYNQCIKKKYDIIFLDHMMPGVDGIECFHMIRDNDESMNKDTPIIMLTANAIEGVKEEYESIGFSDYLAKPFNIKDLENVLFKYLGN